MWYFVLRNDKLVIKAQSKSKHVVMMARERAFKKLPKCGNADYQIVDDKGLQELRDLKAKNQAARRKKGQEQAAKTRDENRKRGKKPHFILCPTCKSKSKLLFSEFGGMQTRKCKRGHLFEVDTFFGFETNKRRVEHTDRPFFSPGGMPYNDFVYGRYKDDPEGKQDR